MTMTLEARDTKRWWILVVLSIATLMVSLDATVINIALPRAQLALHFSNANRQWLITAYALAFGSLLQLGGRLSDLWGRRNALLMGLSGFALASVLGGSATSFAMLVTARAIQGLFGALLAPAVLATLSTTFQEPKERAEAFAIYGAIAASGAAIGLLLGGALTQWASWRWCLFINLFFAAIDIVGVLAFIDKRRSETRTKLDILGTVLASAGLFFVVYGLAHAVTSSWANAFTWASLLCGAGLLVLFVYWQEHSKNPLLPLRIFLQRTRAGSFVALFITNIGIFGISLFLAYYMQDTLGYSPMRTGLAFLPLVVGVTLSAFVASARLLAKTGPRPLIPVGMVLSVMGMVLFTKLPAHSDYFGHVLPGLVITGLGLGLIFAPAIASATANVEKRDAGAAGALVNTTQQIGGSVGTALLNTIAVSAATREGISLFHHHPPKTGVAMRALETTATLHGYTVAFWWAAGIFAFGAILTFFLLENGVPSVIENA